MSEVLGTVLIVLIIISGPIVAEYIGKMKNGGKR